MPTQQQWELTAERIFANNPDQIESVTYTRTIVGTYEPGIDQDNGFPPGDDTNDTSFAADAFIEKRMRSDDQPKQDTVIVWMRGKDFRTASMNEPLSTDDRLVIDSKEHQIVMIESIPESKVPILYKFKATTKAR